jgi:hypothetical protein
MLKKGMEVRLLTEGLQEFSQVLLDINVIYWVLQCIWIFFIPIVLCTC